MLTWMMTTTDDDDERVQKSSYHSHSRVWVNASDASACLWSVGDASTVFLTEKSLSQFALGFSLSVKETALQEFWRRSCDSRKEEKKNLSRKEPPPRPLPASASLCSDTVTFDGSGCLGQGEARRNP